MELTQAQTKSPYEISFPAAGEVDDQDSEWCEVVVDGAARRIRFHDYDEIYALPGLYEQLFYERLLCDSPRIVSNLLAAELESRDESPEELTVLDVGAGNGMMGERLDALGAEEIVGVDIIEQAAEAAERDRPDVYTDYHVVDLTDPPAEDRRQLESYDFDCMTSVAALGFGDIPPEAFAGAYELLADGGWVAFCIKEDFVSAGDPSGFSRLIRDALADGSLERCRDHTYRHRLAIDGEPIDYVAMIARKRSELPL